MKKKIWIALAALVVVIMLGTVAVTWAQDDVPTVQFDVKSKEFSFSNCEMNTYEDGTYPDLFLDIKNAMPGDTFTQKIRVRVVNADGFTVKMYMVAENQNEDYALLFNEENVHRAVLNVAFSEMEAEEANLVRKVLNRLVGKVNELVHFSEPIGERAYLGAYTGESKTRDITVDFSIPKEAGNEIKNLRAEVDWVFIAEVITGGVGPHPTPTPEPTPTPTPEPTPTPTEPIEHPVHEDGIWHLGLVTDKHMAYIVGRPDGYVYPNDHITRAEVAAIFYRLMTPQERDKYWTETNPFTDVPSNRWYSIEVGTLYQAGVLAGYPDGSFRPDQAITRAEFVAIVSRIITARKPVESNFPDVRANYWAKKAIDNAYALQLAFGYDDGKFHPDALITRAEAMAIVNRLLGRHPQLGYLLDDMIVWPDNMNTERWYYLDVQEATNSHGHEFVGDRERWTHWMENEDWKGQENPGSGANTYRSDR